MPKNGLEYDQIKFTPTNVNVRTWPKMTPANVNRWTWPKNRWIWLKKCNLHCVVGTSYWLMQLISMEKTQCLQQYDQKSGSLSDFILYFNFGHIHLLLFVIVVHFWSCSKGLCLLKWSFQSCTNFLVILNRSNECSL